MSLAIAVQSPPAQSTVHSHLALLVGHCPPPPPRTHAAVTVVAPPFPPLSFPLHSSGRFKALVPLTPGENAITIQSPGASPLVYPLTYQPLPDNRPVNLVIIAGADSQLRYDDTQPTSLDGAVSRFRMAAYLWQAYTAEQMYRNGFGHRTFQFAEEWGTDTSTRGAPVPASVAKVSLVRSRRSVAEIRDTNRAQQNKKAGATQGLYDIAREAVAESPEFRNRQDGLQVAALILDSTGTTDRNLIVGHAALGGCGAPFPLAIFGSHTTFAWPSCVEEVVGAFMDTRPVDRRFCGVDCEGSTYGMAANVGIGAMMHEVGHMLSCPHQTHGVMLRDYVRLHKSFIAVDPHDNDECVWHRLDTIRFASHPSFAAPWDRPRPLAQGPILVTASNAAVNIHTPSSSILAIEYRKPGKETADPFIDLCSGPQQHYALARSSLSGFDRITVLTSDGGKLDNFQVTSVFPNAAGVIRTPAFGGKGGHDVGIVPIPPVVSHIRVHAGSALDGIELNGVLFGHRGGRPHDFALQPGETIQGINLRFGAWVDAVQFVTSQQVTPWFGRADGGGPAEVRIPPGHRLSGILGRVGGWIQAIGFEFESCSEQGAPAGHQQQPYNNGLSNATHHGAGGLPPPPIPPRPGGGAQSHKPAGEPDWAAQAAKLKDKGSQLLKDKGGQLLKGKLGKWL